MQSKKLTMLIAGALLVSLAISCTKKRDEAVAGVCNANATPSFNADISSLIQTNCATSIGCHASGSVSGPGPLTNYQQIKAAAGNIKNAVVSKRMPLGASLSDADIQTIKCWVEAGALQN